MVKKYKHIAAFFFLILILTACDSPSEIATEEIETYKQEPAILNTIINQSKSCLRNLSLPYSQDIVLEVTGSEEIPLAGTYNGIREMFVYFVKYMAKIRLLDINYLYTLSGETNMSSHFFIKGQVKRTGKIFDLEYIYYFELDDTGSIDSMTVYYNTYLFREAFQKESTVDPVDMRSGNTYFDTEYSGAEGILNELLAYWGTGDLPNVLEMMNEDVIWIVRNDPVIVPYAGITFDKNGFVNDYVIPIVTDVTIINSAFTDNIIDGNRGDFFIYEENRCNSTGKESTIVGVLSFVIDPLTDKISEGSITYESFAVRDTFIEP